MGQNLILPGQATCALRVGGPTAPPQLTMHVYGFHVGFRCQSLGAGDRASEKPAVQAAPNSTHGN
eukprot:6032945-Pyramimonas_sp.AAC.1